MDINTEDSFGLGKYGKAVETLVNIAKDSFGIIIDPVKKIADAKSEMMIEKQKLHHKYDIQKIELIERAKIRLFETEITRQFNLEQTFSQAVKLLPENASPENINKDWLHHFVASSQDVSEEDLRKIWARLLAGEATNPGKFSKRTLDHLKNFSVDDCKLFEKFLSLVLRHGDTIVFYLPDEGFRPFKDKFNFIYLDFLHLSEMGIVGNTAASMNIDAGKNIRFYYFNKKIMVYNKPLSNDSKIIQAHILIESGSQLAKIVDAEENNQFLDFVVSDIKSQGLEVDITKDCV